MMRNRLAEIMKAKATAIVLMVIYAVMMAVATVIEKFSGTPVAKAVVYYSPLFVMVQMLMVANFIGLTIRYGWWRKRRWAYMAIHGAFIVMLTGAAITHFTGREGMIHLREGERTGRMVLTQGGAKGMQELPFELELTDFKLVRYPGSKSPSSYESELNVYVDGEKREERIYMNNVLDLKGYRLFQASYDPDEQGSILAVNYDAAGRTVTYAGYMLLFAGLVLMLADRRSRFRRLWKRLRGTAAVLVVAMMMAAPQMASAEGLVVPREQAERFGRLPMQSANGRIVPVNTFASEVVRKFKAKRIIGNLEPEQLLMSMMAYPADWAVIPLIEVKEEAIAERFGWQKGRIAYREAFDSHMAYRLYEEVERIYRKNPSERTRADKELLKIDDRINILHGLLTDGMIRLFPNPTDSVEMRWLTAGELTANQIQAIDSATGMAANRPASTDSVWRKEAMTLASGLVQSIRTAGTENNWKLVDEATQRLEAFQLANGGNKLIDMGKLRTEVWYNRMNLVKVCRIGYLILGFILLLLVVTGLNSGRVAWRRFTEQVLTWGIMGFLVLHLVNLIMRCYISGYAPWSNSYETMVSLAWAGVLCGFIFVRSNKMVTALATLFGGCVLFVSGLSWMDPQITPLVPVLKSPWLMAHVASLVMAYGFLGISCMIGTAWMILSATRKKNLSRLMDELTTINELSMIAGTSLMAVGIFLGAVWANESWGRYWSWDPKETWALITLVVYAIVLHLRWFRREGRSDGLFNLLSQLAILSVLMTFLGVNYFLSGMHSYGSHDALAGIPVWVYLLSVAFFTLPAIVCFWGRRKGKTKATSD